MLLTAEGFEKLYQILNELKYDKTVIQNFFAKLREMQVSPNIGRLKILLPSKHCDLNNPDQVSGPETPQVILERKTLYDANGTKKMYWE